MTYPALDSWAALSWLKNDEPAASADNDAVLYTGDPEILAVAGLQCEVRDLRPSG